MPTLRTASFTLVAIALAGCMTSSRSATTAAVPPPPEAEPATSSGGSAAARGEEEERPRSRRSRSDEPSGETRDVAQAVEGEWRLADRDAEANIDRAVTRVTDQMSSLIRGMAAGRIDEEVNPDERVTIQAEGEDQVVVSIGGGRPVRLTLNGGEERTTGADGRPLRVRAMVRRGQLTIVERTDQGRRVLYFQPRGDALVMSTRIQSDRLPADIVYRQSYRRG